MSTHTHRTGGLMAFATTLVSTALRVALALAGFVLALGALLVGLVLSAGLIVWALSRGHRPVMQVFGRQRHGMRGGFAARSPTPAQASRGEVIDGAVREVPTTESRRD